MFRNEPDSGLMPENNTMTRSDYQIWSPTELAAGDVSDVQFFNTGVLFDNSDAVEYSDSVLKNIDTTECKEPFNADDIIDSCINRGSATVDTCNGAGVSHDESDDGANDNEHVKIELPSDPTSVLRSLSTVLDSTGGVDDKNSVFVKIMESSVLMPVQCILINILRATNKIILKRLLSQGVWPILHKWLLEARIQNNIPLMMEILQLCKLMPVNTKLLKSNNFAKDIKQLIKNTDERISRLAKVVVEDWITLVTGVRNSSSKSTGEVKNQKVESPKIVSQQPCNPVVEESPTESNVKSPSDGDCTAEIKERPRPKTVKALPIKFRSTGLECVETENSVKPHVKPPEKSLTQKSLNGSNSISNFLNKPLTTFAQSPKSSKIKIIPARPIQPELSEKSAFLDALKSSSSGPIRRKRKVPSSPTPKVVPSVPLDLNKDEIAAALKSAAQSLTFAEPEVLPSDSVGSSNEEIPVKRAKTKKSVSWASDNDLCDYFYFDVDPGERVNVNKTAQTSSEFNDHRRHEIEMERRALVGMCHSIKKGMSLMEWKSPPVIDGLEQSSTVHGSDSKEKCIQLDRETRVLQVIYFSQDSVPDSPAEPDDDAISMHQECRIIPLDDEEEPMDVESNSELINATKPQPALLPPILTNLLGNIINQSPNIDTHSTASPPVDDAEDNFPHSYSPDDGYNYNQPPGHSMHPESGNNFHQPPRNDFNFQMQQYNNNNNQRDRYNYSDDSRNNHFRPRGSAQPFHQNDFRGRTSGPRRGGFTGQLCQFFMAGNCRFGASCRNVHPR